jgi:hypothetical protein
MKNYMNAYVVKIARYLEKTSNHVMYRTTPVFVGEELMCRGVLMEAYSVEDNGEGICFNIFLYNLGLTIFRICTYIAVEFIICGIIVDKIKKSEI